MRIISQGKFTDINYDDAVLIINDNNDGKEIHAFTEGMDKPVICLGKYKCRADTLKVMEMIREAYSPKPIEITECDFTDDNMTSLKQHPLGYLKESSITLIDNYYFYMPQADEV